MFCQMLLPPKNTIETLRFALQQKMLVKLTPCDDVVQSED